MISIYFVTAEQYKLYDEKLKPQERYTDRRLADLGIKNMKCGPAALVVTSDRSDDDLPAHFYLVTEGGGNEGKA